MADNKERSRAHSAALLAAVKKQPGTFKEVFARAWPVFRKSHVGGEEMARYQSYELLHKLSMRGKINKINKVYHEALPKRPPPPNE
jgi:predicted transposase YbfD/YdcC